MAAGCGVNNAGDPVAPTRALVAPAPPNSHADVYCVPITVSDPATQECGVELRAGTKASESEAVAWWFRAADAIRPRVGNAFSYEDQTFIYRDVGLFRRATSGDWAPVGWICPGDSALSADAATLAMVQRNPLAKAGFRTEQQARTAGCTLAISPARGDTLAALQLDGN